LAQDLLHDVIKEARSLGWVQWLAFLTGLVYIYFATRSDARCWIWGILSSALWAYTSWFQLNLLSDSILQMIYVVLVLGLYSWRIKKTKLPPVSHCSPAS
jgi:nicotinamide riboside transporter PnuC